MKKDAIDLFLDGYINVDPKNMGKKNYKESLVLLLLSNHALNKPENFAKYDFNNQYLGDMAETFSRDGLKMLENIRGNSEGFDCKDVLVALAEVSASLCGIIDYIAKHKTKVKKEDLC